MTGGGDRRTGTVGVQRPVLSSCARQKGPCKCSWWGPGAAPGHLFQLQLGSSLGNTAATRYNPQTTGHRFYELKAVEPANQRSRRAMCPPHPATGTRLVPSTSSKLDSFAEMRPPTLCAPVAPAAISTKFLRLPWSVATLAASPSTPALPPPTLASPSPSHPPVSWRSPAHPCRKGAKTTGRTSISLGSGTRAPAGREGIVAQVSSRV